MSNIYEEIARSYYNRSSDQIMSNEQKQFFDNLTLIRILEEKNKELQDRINKAIDFIENVIRYYNGEDIEKAFYLYIHKDMVHDLLNILQGKE